MSEATLKQTLVWRGIECEKLDMSEAHEAVNQLREHLEARAEQTRPLVSELNVGSSQTLDEFAGLLGVALSENSDA